MNTANPTVYRQYLAQGGAVDLGDRAQLVLKGPDRVRYLNGQVTSDVRKLGVGQTQAACVTTAKGKLCADIFITAQAEALFIDAEASLRETLLPRLERYIVADDVTIDDVTESQVLVHFLGGPPPSLPDVGPLSAANRFGRAGWDLRLSRESFAAVREQLFAGRAVLDSALVDLLRIEAGLPRWGCELDENTLPPEAGLDRTHIDYHKGCYIGQEVISRLRSVGHVNRRLTGFVAEGEGPLAPGMHLFAAENDRTPLGMLTSAAYSFALEKPIALGYLKRGSPTGALFARLEEARGTSAVVTPRELPFVS